MQTMNKTLVRVVAVLLLAAMILPVLSSCKKPGSADLPVAGEKTEYTVTVKNEEGIGLEGIGIYVYEDETKAQLAWFDKTNADGQIVFSDLARDTYVAVLENVPTGYVAQEQYALTGPQTEIILEVGVLDENAMANMKFNLGDKMMDFTVTDTDGNSYTLYELLQTKKAVVLNFWYTNCEPCKMEFPYLAEAYSKYANDIALLALNPVDTDAATVAAFKTENGLSFPVVAADPLWESVMQVTGYPTTVVIDRFGNISLIHKGSIESTNTFEQIFQYFSADDYVSKPIKSVEEILVEQPIGTKENPFETGSFTKFDVTVKPGETYYIRLYKQVEKYYLSVEGKDCDGDFTLSLQEKNHEDDDGEVTVLVKPVGSFVPLEMQITNNSKEEQTYTFRRSAPKGSLGNPYKLQLEEFEAKVPAGSNEGIYYTYTATEDGKLTITCLQSSVGDKYGMVLYNLNSYAMRTWETDGKTDKDGNATLSIDAKKGQKIQFILSTEPNDSNKYPAGTFKLKATFGEGEQEITINDLPKTAYTITVKDQFDVPVSQVSIGFAGDFTYVVQPETPEESEPAAQAEASEPTEGEATNPTEGETLPTFQIKVNETLVTDDQGVASTEQISGPYTATVRAPEGYRLENPQVALTAEAPEVTVQLHKIIMKDYTVTLVYSDGTPVSGVSVMLGTELKTTDNTGTVSFNKEEGQYAVNFVMGIPESYVLPDNKTTVAFPEGETAMKLTLVGIGGQENPYLIDQFPFTTKALATGDVVYAKITAQVHYDAAPTLVVSDADSVIVYDGVRYLAENGKVQIPLKASADTVLKISNSGAQTKAQTLELQYPLGSRYNPAPIDDLKEISVSLAAGDQDGYYLKYTPEYAGKLTLKVTGTSPADAQYTATVSTVENTNVILSNTNALAYVGSMEDALIFVQSSAAGNPALELTLSGSFAIDPTAVGQGKGVYRVTVTDYSDKPISGAVVLFMAEGEDEPVAQGITDANGKLPDLLLDKAVYRLNIAFTNASGTAYNYDKSAAVLTPNVTQLTVKMTEIVPGSPVSFQGSWAIGNRNAAVLKQGSTYVSGLQSVHDASLMTFLLFKPTKAGTYWVTSSNPDVDVSYWKTEWYPQEASKTEEEIARNGIMINVDPKNSLDVYHVIGVYGPTGATETVLTISYLDQYKWSIEHEEYKTDWVSDYKIEQFKLPDGVTYSELTYVDIMDDTKRYEAVYNETDQLYHLNAADGPVLYINFGTNAPYIKIYEMMHGDGTFGGSGLSKIFLVNPKDDITQENFIKMEDYTERIDEYIAAADKDMKDYPTECIYPLTEDIVYAISNGCEHMWTDESNLMHTTFLPAVDGREWMFAVCYYDDGTVDLSYPVEAVEEPLEQEEALLPKEEELLPPVEENPQEIVPDPETTEE